uniref:C2H2-type domain-containing protein n=1 Tax=Caenorhabditis tropicalis TaxID=1561998 RepID=A0A1I7UUV9_9PELO
MSSSSSSSDSGDERKLPAAYQLPREEKKRRKRVSSSSSSATYSEGEDKGKRGGGEKRKKKKKRKDRPMWKEEGELSGESEEEEEESDSSSSENERRRRRRRQRREREEEEKRKRRRERKTFRCDECGCKCFSLKGLIHHQLGHNLGAQCHLCKKKFETKKSFREHYEMEHTQEMVKCVFCKSSFDLPLDMKGSKWEEFHTHVYGEIFYSRIADHEERAHG